MLYASHVAMASWFIGGCLGILIILFGMYLYRFSEKAAVKSPLKISCSYFLGAYMALPLLLILGNHLVLKNQHHLLYARYQNVLPLKEILFPLKQDSLHFKAPLKHNLQEQAVLNEIKSATKELDQHPDIVLFVIESLREDFLSKTVAPHLFQFKQENFSPKWTYSNANNTQGSWFSLFFSRLPFYFGNIRADNWETGSPALNYLKKLGYSIEIFSSVRLNYYQMMDLIFAKDGKLVDNYHLYPHDDDIQAYQSDSKTIRKLVERLEQPSELKQGRCFVVFLESTHFDYSWPKHQFTEFTPIIDSINYLGIALSKNDLESIKNRYRNAIHYVDSLFGEFIETFKRLPSWKDSLVVVTGDHGEEFYEQGHLFHCSHLSHMQTNVPIYLKLGDNQGFSKDSMHEMASHIDIFPTIFHHLLNQDNTLKLFDGQSIFSQAVWPYVVIGRYNASQPPSEYLVHNGDKKLLIRFNNSQNLFDSTSFKIVQLKSREDETVAFTLAEVHREFDDAFKKLFTH